MRRLLAGLLLACAALPARVLGHAANPSSVLELGTEKLRPGQFVWTPELAPSGLMTIVVNLAAQRAHIYRDGVEIGFASISSGRRGYETPTGVFTILQKDRHHHSNKYDDAPMPFMQRLTWGGIALHGGRVPGYPASHGCIRLPMTFSQTLFKETSTGGTTVIITEGSPSAEALAEQAMPLGNADFRWQPELSPTGPVTVLVSFNTRQLLILRDGMIIGRARMEIPAGVVRDPRALQIVATGQGQETQWFHAGLSGLEAVRSQPPNADQVVQVRVAPEFLANLRAAATPGETMLIAEDAITGGDMPLIVMVSN
jgi:L,D-transpeptidase catalytic domain